MTRCLLVACRLVYESSPMIPPVLAAEKQGEEKTGRTRKGLERKKGRKGYRQHDTCGESADGGAIYPYTLRVSI